MECVERDEPVEPDLHKLRRDVAITVVVLCVIAVFAVLNVLDEDWDSVGANVFTIAAIGAMTVRGWRRQSRMARLVAESEARIRNAPRRWSDG